MSYMLEQQRFTGKIIEVGLNPLYYDRSTAKFELENGNFLEVIVTHKTAKRLAGCLYETITFSISEPSFEFPAVEVAA